MSDALWAGFMSSAEQFGDHDALIVEGKAFSYSELLNMALAIAATLQCQKDSAATPLTAVLAYRSATAFAGVLGSLLAGDGYVPLNPTFPVERTKTMFERSGCRSLIVDEGGARLLEELLEGRTEELVILVSSDQDVESYRGRWPQHTILGTDDLASPSKWKQPSYSPDAVAYLLFTSGTTGVPKGVAVANRNVRPFIDYMVERYQISERDRFSQMFDMTFDLSVFDMFVCWERGGCLCCPSQKTLIKPSKFINEMGLTVWFSVPSTAVFMKQLRLLKPNQYPSLRWSLFCGEPLPVSSATAWLEAAPNSTLENLYGPTELTIACTLYRWNPTKSPIEAEMGIVPIGQPYPGMKALVVDEHLMEVSPGSEGELLMNGPQMSLGYWNDPGKTAVAFVQPPHRDEIYYRTGDRVRRPLDGQPMTHLGRVDFQVKVLGHRVELGEIEVAVREACGLDGVIAVGWPLVAGGYGGIEAFIEGRAENGSDNLRDQIARRLPDYMIPRRFHFMDRLPRNVNNKFDRKAMAKLLEEGL